MERQTPKRNVWLAIISIGLTITLCILIILHREFIDELRHWGYLGLFLVTVVASGTMVLPGMGAVITFTFGGVLNPAVVGLVAGLGEATGAVGAYLTGYGGRGFMVANPLKGRLSAFMERHGAKAMFLMAALVNPIYYPFAVWMGVLRVRVGRFFIYTLLGRTLKNLLLAYLGFFGLRTFLRLMGIQV